MTVPTGVSRKRLKPAPRPAYGIGSGAARRAVKENLLRVLSTLIGSSLVASIGFAQDAKSEKTGRHRSIESERKEAADAAGTDSPAEQAEEPVEMVVGSPPMVSDDTGTPGNGNWEINVVLDGDISKDSNAFELPLMDINYGIGDRFQLKYEMPYVVTRNTKFDENGEGTEQASGVSNSKVGLKYRFYDNDRSGLSLAVYPQVEFRTSGSKLEGEPDEGGEGGVAEEGVTCVLPILLTKEFQRASITANLGAEKTTEDNHVGIAASFGVGTRLTDELAVMGEIAGQDLNSVDERRILLNFGFRLKISAKQAFVGSVGHDIQDGADGQKHLYATLAYQHFFQSKKR
jgi:Putative MetA-pathway of phenol degradation